MGKLPSGLHSSLSFRRFFPFLIIIFLIILMTFWGITHFSILAIETHAQETLSNCKQFIIWQIREIRDDAGTYAHYIANSQHLSDFLDNPSAVHSINTPLAAILKHNHIEARIYKANSTDIMPEIVHKGLSGLDVAEFGKIQAGGQPALKLDMVHPIEGESGRVEEAVLISRTLDKSFFISLKHIINAEISLIYDGRIALTTMDTPDLRELLGRTILPLINENESIPVERCCNEFEYKNKIISTLLFPLPDSGHTNIFVAISIMPPGMAITREIFWRGTAFILMTLVILLLLTYAVFSMLIINPLREFSATVREVSNGNLDCLFEVNSSDELGEVKTTLNTIISNLRKSKQEIQLLHQQFEGRVNLKTQILQEQNYRLRSSDKKLKNILDQSEVGIFHLERNLNLEYINARIAKLCGLSTEDILQQAVTDFIYFPKPDEAIFYLEQIMEGQLSGHTFQAHLIRRDKSLLEINIQCGPFYIDDEIAGIRGIIWEINS